MTGWSTFRSIPFVTTNKSPKLRRLPDIRPSSSAVQSWYGGIMKLYLLAAASALCATQLPLAAQTSTDPPPVLRILREDIKEGRERAHRNNENAFMLEAATAHYPVHVLGMSALTGTGQAWFLEAHDSFEAIEKTLSAFGAADSKFAQIDELDAEFRSGSRSYLAAYRPD